jgi:hypothetical protein
MPVSIDNRVKEQMLKRWISGESRDKIAADNGAGTVTNLISEWKKRLDDPEFDSVRGFAVSLKKQGICLSELATRARLYNYIRKLGADEHQIETLIANLLDSANSLSPEKTVDLVNQLYEISETESIAATEVPAYINHKIEEKKRIEEEIQKTGALLEDQRIDIQIIEEYKKLEEELKKHGLSMEALNTLVSILQNINELGYDPRKIVTELARIKSIRHTERRLKRECKMLESQSAQYREILPICKDIVSFEIGFSELAALHAAVMKKVDMENISYGEAAYALMNDIDTPWKEGRDAKATE